MIFLLSKSFIQFTVEISTDLFHTVKYLDHDPLFNPTNFPLASLIYCQVNCISLLISKCLLAHYLSLQFLHPDSQYLFRKYR